MMNSLAQDGLVSPLWVGVVLAVLGLVSLLSYVHGVFRTPSRSVSYKGNTN
jgi:hypothetical protein